MSRYTSREYMYTKQPLSTQDNRDEYFLIDVAGNWIPECDLIYYGLLNSSYSDNLYKLKNTIRINPHEIYLDTCYFESKDLIRYLASEDKNSLADLDDEYILSAIATAITMYTYEPCNEPMIRHAIIEAAYYDFVKTITLVYPWPIRPIDRLYLKSIIPNTVIGKFNLVTGPLIDVIRNNKISFKYTTIISNSHEDINEMIDKCNEYGTDTSFYLLRNHSGNVKFEMIKDPENEDKLIPKFTEIGTMEILSKLVDMNTGIPKTQMRFARYEPILFEDGKPNSNDFLLGK